VTGAQTLDSVCFSVREREVVVDRTHRRGAFAYGCGDSLGGAGVAVSRSNALATPRLDERSHGRGLRAWRRLWIVAAGLASWPAAAGSHLERTFGFRGW
jgi:hypothetical protein